MPVRDAVEVRICSPKPLYAGELMFIVQPVPTRAVAITLTVGECAALCSAALFGAFARSMQARPVWRAACMPALRRAARLKPDMRRGRALSAQPYHARSPNAHRGERICLKAHGESSAARLHAPDRLRASTRAAPSIRRQRAPIIHAGPAAPTLPRGSSHDPSEGLVA